MSGSPCVEGSWVEPSSEQTFSYRLWRPATSRALLVIVHGFGEHSGRYEAVAKILVEQGICVAALDLWGHGRSGGARGDLGQIADCAKHSWMMTTEVFLPQSGQERYALFGHSFGGLVAILWALDYPSNLRRLVIQSPLLEVGFPIPKWKKAAAALLVRCWPRYRLPIDLDPAALSHDPAIREAYLADPLVHNAMSARTYTSILQAQEEVFERAPTLRMPVLLMCGGEDRIISVDAAQRWIGRVVCEKRNVVFPDCYHELHHERIRDEALRLVCDWVSADA